MLIFLPSVCYKIFKRTFKSCPETKMHLPGIGEQLTSVGIGFPNKLEWPESKYYIISKLTFPMSIFNPSKPSIEYLFLSVKPALTSNRVL